MIGVLKELNVQAMAIDQPIDFEIPESIVMLAVYLSIPEAENSRRGRNTSDGMRRAKKMGRWPGRAPIGYVNQTAPDGRKFIAPKQPEADHVRWSFQQFAKGLHSISQVRKMACLNGFQCSKNNFWKLLHNPVYCGLVKVPPTKTEDIQFVKAVHDPLISERLFNDVQLLLRGKQKQLSKRQDLKYLFPLRGFLQCPYCNRRLTGSISQGRKSKYRYYHCASIKCKGRFRADKLDASYEEQLKSIHLMPEVYELFELVLEDENILATQRKLEDEHKIILYDIDQQQILVSKARKLLLTEKIGVDDFKEFKKESAQALEYLNDQLIHLDSKLNSLGSNHNVWLENKESLILQSYRNHDIVGKRQIISLISPISIDLSDVAIKPLTINKTLSDIVCLSENMA